MTQHVPPPPQPAKTNVPPPPPAPKGRSHEEDEVSSGLMARSIELQEQQFTKLTSSLVELDSSVRANISALEDRLSSRIVNESNSAFSALRSEILSARLAESQSSTTTIRNLISEERTFLLSQSELLEMHRLEVLCRAKVEENTCQRIEDENNQLQQELQRLRQRRVDAVRIVESIPPPQHLEVADRQIALPVSDGFSFDKSLHLTVLPKALNEILTNYADSGDVHRFIDEHWADIASLYEGIHHILKDSGKIIDDCPACVPLHHFLAKHTERYGPILLNIYFLETVCYIYEGREAEFAEMIVLDNNISHSTSSKAWLRVNSNSTSYYYCATCDMTQRFEPINGQNIVSVQLPKFDSVWTPNSLSSFRNVRSSDAAFSQQILLARLYGHMLSKRPSSADRLPENLSKQQLFDAMKALKLL